jgi:hypothetical protein
MKKYAELTTAVLAATALLALVPAETAHALNATSYVATSGSDTNTCQHADPCLTFPKAISAAFPGGEVRCLDQLGIGGFPTNVTITQSITIDCRGIYGEVQRVGPTTTQDIGFIINGAGISVTLRGLNIAAPEGGSAGNIGINIQQAASVHIEDCTIRGFTVNASQGIRIAPTAGFTTVTIINTIISNNGLGIFALGAQGLLVNLDHVKMYNNAFGGFRASGANGGVFVNIVDSTANANGTNGFVATGGPVVIDMQRSNASLNQQAGILADGAGAKITIGASTVTANGTGFARTNGGAIVSHGNNNVDDNTVAGLPSGSAGQL